MRPVKKSDVNNSLKHKTQNIMKKKTFIYGPVGSGKAAKARQVNPNIPIGNIVEKDLSKDEIRTIKDIGCEDTTQGMIFYNVPDVETFVRVIDLISPLLADESGIISIVFTSAHIKPFSLPASIANQTEIILSEYENEKQLIYADDERGKGEIRNLEALAKYLNAASNICKSLPFPTPFKNDELGELIYDTKNYVKSKQVGNKELTINNLKLNREKLMDMVELPEDFSKLEKIVSLAQTQIQNLMLSRRLAEPKDVLQLYILNGDDDLELKARIYQKVKEDNEVYVQSAKAKEAYFFAKEYVALLKKYNVGAGNDERLISAYRKIKGGRFQVNWEGIKSREVNNLGFHTFSNN